MKPSCRCIKKAVDFNKQKRKLVFLSFASEFLLVKSIFPFVHTAEMGFWGPNRNVNQSSGEAVEF